MAIVHDKKLKKDICLAFVYGPAHEEGREQFLLELAQMCNGNNYPMMIGGDFNIMRFSSDKNKKFCRNKWTDLFNHVINTHELRELQFSGGKYTWSNNQQDPILEKLDRVLINKDWEKLFPLTTIQKKPRVSRLSDHKPLIVYVEKKLKNDKQKPFRFELTWLNHEDFRSKMKEIWSQPVIAKTNLDRWLIKEKRVKKYLKGWGNKKRR